MPIYDNWQKISRKLELALSKKDERLVFYTPEETKAFIESRNIEINYSVYNPNKHFNFIEIFQYTKQLFALDLETTGLDPLTDEIVSLAISWSDDDKEDLQDLGTLQSLFIYWKDIRESLLNAFTQFLYNNTFIFHQAKFDLSFLSMAGFDIDKIDIRDSQLSAYLNKPGRKTGLKHLAAEILNFYYDDFKTLTKGKTILEVDEDKLAKYNCSDTVATYQLEKHFDLFRDLRDRDLYHIELKVSYLLTRMELTGINIDKNELLALQELNSLKLSELETEANSLVPNINLGSPTQLQQAIFTDLNVSTLGIKKIKTGYSTDADNLAIALANCESTEQKRFIELVLEHKALKKIQSTYVTGILNKVTSQGKIHTNFNQAVTVTGRLSSSKPNLQNVPKQSRKAFIAPSGRKLVAIDYSQCELRILAHFSKEPTLVNAFTEGLDPHMEVAKKLLKKGDISKEERRVCKTINFGMIYGMESHKLAVMTGYPIKMAKQFLDDYWLEFPYIANYMRKVHLDVIEFGYTETVLGRKRYFEFYNKFLINNLRDRLSRCDGFQNKVEVLDRYKKEFSEYESKILREAGNAPIQGSNADITKLAMISTDKAIKKHGFNATLLLQIHDELVWEVNKKEVTDFIEVMSAAMVDVVRLDVPLTVDYAYGNRWSDTK